MWSAPSCALVGTSGVHLGSKHSCCPVICGSMCRSSFVAHDPCQDTQDGNPKGESLVGPSFEELSGQKRSSNGRLRSLRKPVRRLKRSDDSDVR